MTARSLTVLLVTPNLDIGGAQETTRTLATQLPAAGCPTVVCSFAEGPLAAELERAGVPLEPLPGRQHAVTAFPAFVAEMVRLRRDLRAIIERHGIDVIQTQHLGTLAFLVMTLHRHAQVWWRIGNVRFMVREEHLPRHPWLLRPKRAAHRWLYRRGARIVNGIIAVSDDTARAIREQIGGVDDRVTVVLNGVDIDRYPARTDPADLRGQLGLGPQDHLMTMVGTFKRQKGHTHLVAATAAVAKEHPGLHVLLVGDGHLRPEIEAQVRRAGLAARVHLLGSRRDVPELLAASDSFVLPSLFEGMSVALIEAMASGLPVIATDVSGTNQVMVHGQTGWLVPPGDAPALATAISQLLMDERRAAAAGTAARNRIVTSFSAQAQAMRLAELYRNAATPLRRVPGQPAGAGQVART